MNEEIISRAIGNLGFDFEEAILEAVDDAFEAASAPTPVKLWFTKKAKGYSCIVGDKSGGANYAKIFNLQSGNRYADRYNSVRDIYEKTGLFNAGSFSYLNISNEVWFFTKHESAWKSISLIKDKDTGDFKKVISDDNPTHIIGDIEFEIDFEEFDSVLYIKDFNRSSNQSVKDFRVKESFNGFKKNLRVTYYDKLMQGYELIINGKPLTPLDVFYKHELGSHVKEVVHISITLQELLEKNSYFEDDIMARYFEVFNRDASIINAKEDLLSQSLEIKLYSYDTKYFNEHYFKSVAPSDAVTFNMQTSGFWLFRNGRKIGNPATLSTMGFVEQHPSLNIFRAEVHFSPIFDIYFGIQVNKNRYIVSEEVKECLEDKIAEAMRYQNTTSFKTFITTNFDETTEFKNGDSSTQLTLGLGEPDADKEDSRIKFKHTDTLWQKAQKLCLCERELAGYTVKDVSKSRVGYDVKAYNQEIGDIQYIEVKSLERSGASFEITVEEYAKLKHYKENYYICLVLILEDSADFIYINNPEENVVFNETIKIVGYSCKNYKGEAFSMTFDELDIL